MASYKVPQDVEADDKLIGPFSFRQFIYLIIVVLAGALAWGLSNIFIGLAIIPLPVILLFGALALPLRKDQPMEIYLAAMIAFYTKPRQRLWDPEGIESNIEITAPKTIEAKRTKDLSETEASERLNYLASLVDSKGWSIRGVAPGQNIAMNTDVVLEAQGAEDILANNTSIANTFNQMMEESSRKMREEARERMFASTAAPAVQAQPAQQTPAAYYNPAPQPAAQPTPPQPIQTTPTEEPIVFNPYPKIQQTVIQPIDTEDHVSIDLAPVDEIEPVQKPVEPAATSTSETTPSTDIIELANNSDLSVQTIAHRANDIKKKSEDSGEVVISLR